MREEYLVNRLSQNEKTKHRHNAALRQGSNGFQSLATRNNINTETVNQGVAKHIQRIGH